MEGAFLPNVVAISLKISLKDLFSDAEITIMLNAEDLEYISKNFTSSKITCTEGLDLKPGDATIQHKQGFIDLTLESRVQVLKDHFESVKTGDGLGE